MPQSTIATRPRAAIRPARLTRRLALGETGTTVVAGLAVALLAWPLQGFTVIEPGDDGSWVIGLHMASHQGMRFGSDLVWTYGPLGFLTVPVLSYPLQGALSFAYVALVQGGTGIATVWAARRSLPLWPAVGAAFVVTLLLPVTDSDDHLSSIVLVAVFIACVAVVRSSPRPGSAAAAWFPPLAGAVSGLEALIRLNAGLTIVAICGLAVLVGFPGARVRAVATFAGAFCASALALWLAAGQAIGDIPAYLTYSYDLISGHSQALATEDAPVWDYPVAVVAGAVLVGIAHRATAGWPGLARAGVAVMTGVLMFSAFKQAFVRHDESHAPFFFAVVLGAALAFGWPRERPRQAAVTLAVLAAAFLVVARPPLASIAPPERSPLQAAQQLRALLTPEPQIAASREALRMQEGVDPGTAAMLRGRSVHVWPTEAAVAWAHPEMVWHPVPTLQSKIAYTRRLDVLDARALSSSAGPEMVLRSANDNPFAAPAAGTALFCHYAQVRATSTWQVLARVPNRCGRLRLIESVHTKTGKPFPVPPAGTDEMVVARIRGPKPGLAESLSTFLFRAPVWRASGRGDEEHDLAPGTAIGFVMLRVPPSFDYPGRFSRSPAGKSFVVSGGPALTANRSDEWRRPIEVELYAIRLRAPSVSAG